VLIYVSFYVNDGRKYMSYVPKSSELKRRMWQHIAWLAFLKAWTKTIWHAIEGQILKLKTKREFRRCLKIVHKYKTNTRFKHKQIRCIQHQLGQRVYHDLVVQQAIMVMEAYENKTERKVVFDTDSKPVGIDNHASAYIFFRGY
jgi:hypothetical protein